MSRPVVSADDVRAAHRRGEERLYHDPDAIVTPLARDEAARVGMDLIGGADPVIVSTRTPPAPPDHTATCDDPENALESVVSMVRARVPDADPARVREIARRVLERLGP